MRQGNGFIQVIPASSFIWGMLNIFLNEAPSLNEQQCAIIIQKNVTVFIN